MHLKQRRLHLSRAPILQANVVRRKGVGKTRAVHKPLRFEYLQLCFCSVLCPPVSQLPEDLNRGSFGTRAPISYLRVYILF